MYFPTECFLLFLRAVDTCVRKYANPACYQCHGSHIVEVCYSYTPKTYYSQYSEMKCLGYTDLNHSQKDFNPYTSILKRSQALNDIKLIFNKVIDFTTFYVAYFAMTRSSVV